MASWWRVRHTHDWHTTRQVLVDYRTPECAEIKQGERAHEQRCCWCGETRIDKPYLTKSWEIVAVSDAPPYVAPGAPAVGARVLCRIYQQGLMSGGFSGRVRTVALEQGVFELVPDTEGPATWHHFSVIATVIELAAPLD